MFYWVVRHGSIAAAAFVDEKLKSCHDGTKVGLKADFSFFQEVMYGVFSAHRRRCRGTKQKSQKTFTVCGLINNKLLACMRSVTNE